MIINWTEKYSVNNEILDIQHKKLIAIVNDFSIAISEEKAVEVLEDVLNEMSAYAWLHFRTEEDLLSKSGYENQEDHKQIHDQFKKELMHFVSEFNESKDLQLVAKVHQFLFHWLQEHILVEDMKYKHLLK